MDNLLILTSGTEQYLITCTNKKIYIFTDNYLDNQRLEDKETMQSLLREADWVYMGNSERDGKKMLELEFRFELAEKLKKTND